MFRLFGRRTTAAAVARHPALAAGSVTPWRRFQDDGGTMSHQQMWSLWNEGNLFSLTPGQLASFLEANGTRVKPDWKKAALVRQVEEMLAAKEETDKQQKAVEPAEGKEGKGWAARVEAGPAPGKKGATAKPKEEVLLDLQQSNFYDGDGVTAPRAFQVLVPTASPDLCVSRVNTTLLPGFPSNTECYTLNGTDAEASISGRFRNAMEFAVMNMTNLGLQGEVYVDFGKLLVKPDVVRRKQIVSSWMLQQQLQQKGENYVWISSLPPDIEETALSVLSKVGVGEPKSSEVISHEVILRRKADTLQVMLDGDGKTTGVQKNWEQLLNSHIVGAEGVDARIQLRSRTKASQDAVSEIMQMQLLDLSEDTVTSKVPAHVGEVLYAAELETKEWTLEMPHNAIASVRIVRRTPLMIHKNEEFGERTELSMTIPLNTDMEGHMKDVATNLYTLSKTLAEKCHEPYCAYYGLQPEMPNLGN